VQGSAGSLTALDLTFDVLAVLTCGALVPFSDFLSCSTCDPLNPHYPSPSHIMPRFPEANEHSYRQSPDISPNRPPQLNESNCSCHSRCAGCSGESEGDGGGTRDGDNDSTLVGSEPDSNADADEDLHLNISPSDGPEDHVVLEAFEETPTFCDEAITEFLARYLSGSEESGFSEHMHLISMDELAAHLRQTCSRGYDDDSISMQNHGGSEDQRSVMSSYAGSVTCATPSQMLRGLGDLFDDDGVLREFPYVGMNRNYFVGVGKPLRLTAQRRNCRGLVASHLVVRDV